MTMLRRRTLLAAGAFAALPAHARGRTIRVEGAKGDGRTLATHAIQAAIDRAGPGDTVVLDPGTYLTGALFVRSGVTLRIDRGVTLLGSQDDADYPVMPTRIAGIETVWPAALVNLYRVRGARLLGEGTIDGDGKRWWDAYRALRRDYDPRGLRWAADYDCRRPRLIQLFEAGDAEVGGGLQLRRSGFWTVHVCYSRNVRVADVTIRNNEGGRGPSTDGIDIDSSSHVLVERADIACNDDALCLKAGRDFDGLRVARPCEHVTIRDCTIRDAAAGVTFGSETSGGIRDVDVARLDVRAPTPNGILFKSAHTRGGHVERIAIRDIAMQGVKTALRIDLNWNPTYSYATIPEGLTDIPPLWRTLATPVLPPERGLPHLSDVTIADVRAAGTARAFDVAAYPGAPLDRFRFDGIRIDAPDGGTIADARDWHFTRTSLAARPTVQGSSKVTGL
jgi:polygalacturonase